MADQGVKTFWCARCGKTHRSQFIPRSWIGIRLYGDHPADERAIGMGIYCGISCALADGMRLESIEKRILRERGEAA